MNFRKIHMLIVATLLVIGDYTGPLFAQGAYFDWAKSIGGKGYDQSVAVATDAFGNVYTVGSFNDTADFDPGSEMANLVPKGSYDVFISKFDATGNYLWAKHLGGIGQDQARAIHVDNLGYVYITGYFNGTADFDPGADVAELTGAGSFDVFVCKLDTGGHYVWAKGMGGLGADYGSGITTDSVGNVYITGQFSATANFDPGTSVENLTSAGSYDIFACKLDSTGDFQWAKSMGGTGSDQGRSVVVDASGSVYTTGIFQTTADFDPGSAVANLSTSSAFDYDAFVAKLDANGEYVWAKQIGSTGLGDNGNALTIDATGIYITGRFELTVDFDPGPGVANLTTNGNTDIFLCKWNTDGGYEWAIAMGGAGNETGSSISIDVAGNLYLSGSFEGTVDFDPGAGTANLVADGDYNSYVGKWNNNGDYLWVKGISGITQANNTTDQSGNVYLTGGYGTGAIIIDFDPTAGVFELSSVSGSQDTYVLKLACGDTSSSVVNIDTCTPNFIFNGETYTVSGTYTQKQPNAAGCDSTITLNLIISELDPVITVDEFVLGTVVLYDTYQWLLNGEVIPGATGSTYTVSENGDYQVVVASVPCTDTSVIYTVDNVGIEETNAGHYVRIYPNPAVDWVYIQAPAAVQVTVRSIDGRLIREIKETKAFSVAELPVGIYMLQLKDIKGKWQQVEKLVKQK